MMTWNGCKIETAYFCVTKVSDSKWISSACLVDVDGGRWSSRWLYSEPLCFVLPEQLTVTCSWGWSDTRDGNKSSSALIWRDSSPTNHLHTCVFPNLHSCLLWNTRFYFGKGFHCFCPYNESQWDPEEHWTSFKKHKYHRDFFFVVLVWEEKFIQVWNDIWRSKLFWVSFPFKSQLPKNKSGLLNLNQIMTKCTSLAQQPMPCEIRINQVFHTQNTDIIC